MSNSVSNGSPVLTNLLLVIVIGLAGWALLKISDIKDDTTALKAFRQSDRSDIDALKSSDIKQDVRLAGVETDIAVIKAKVERQ
jgi:hypothetical protein